MVFETEPSQQTSNFLLTWSRKYVFWIFSQVPKSNNLRSEILVFTARIYYLSNNIRPRKTHSNLDSRKGKQYIDQLPKRVILAEAPG